MVNPALVVWPTDTIRLFLVGNGGKLREVSSFSAEAVLLLRQFSAPLRISDVLGNTTTDDLRALSEAVEAGLLLKEEAFEDDAVGSLFDGFRLMDWKQALINAKEITAKTTRQIAIGLERSVVVLDDVLSLTRVNTLARWLRSLPYRLADYDTEETYDVKHWISEFRSPSELVNCVPVLSEIVNLGSHIFPEFKLNLTRLHANASLFGDLQFPHRDTDREGVTILYFGNDYWETEWMGETLFYDDSDPVFAINPKPGRLVIFHSDIIHRAGVPSRLCMGARWTLSFKFLALVGSDNA